jgi:hypothetical protein
MLKEYKTTVKFPVFDYDVHVIFCESVMASRERRCKKLGETDGERYYAMHSCVNGWESYLFLPLNCKPGVIAHECFHAIFNMFTKKGVKLENETWAYHLDWLIKEIEGFKTRRKIK